MGRTWDLGAWGHGDWGLGDKGLEDKDIYWGTWNGTGDWGHFRTCRKMLQCGINSISEVTGERCYNVSRKIGSYSGKMLQHSIDSIVKVTWKRYFKVASRLSWWLPVTDATMYIKSVLVVSKASLRLLKTYVTRSHQERLGTYLGKFHHIASKALRRLLKKILQHGTASIVKVTWERCYNLASNVLEEEFQSSKRRVLEVTWERCCDLAWKA